VLYCMCVASQLLYGTQPVSAKVSTVMHNQPTNLRPKHCKGNAMQTKQAAARAPQVLLCCHKGFVLLLKLYRIVQSGTAATDSQVIDPAGGQTRGSRQNHKTHPVAGSQRPKAWMSHTSHTST
jgi:hypothetical protein